MRRRSARLARAIGPPFFFFRALMFGLSAVNTVFLYALSAAAIPIIIHFLFKARKQQIYFSSIEFILASTVLKSSRIKFRELLLLLLRVAIVALITLAFVRPFFRRNLSAFGLAGQTDLVFLLDDSYSMRYKGKRGPCFQNAVARALRAVRQCKAGDRVGVVRVTPGAAPALRLTPNFGMARAALKRLRPTFLSGALADGLERAVRLLNASNADNKVVFILSDFQQAAWGYMGPVLAKLPADIKIHTANLAAAEPANLAVLDLRSVRPVFEPGEKIRLLARVANYSSRIEPGAAATLFVDGRPAAEKTCRLKPYEVRELAFQFAAPDRDAVTCRVKLEPEDGLLVDNSAWCVVAQGRPLRVLCVETRPSDAPFFQETFYLRTAINPTAGDMRPVSSMRAELIDAAQLEKTSAFGFDVVVLADVVGVNESQARHLENYVRSGGGLLVFLGPHVEPAIYNKLLFRRGEGVLPARLVDIVATLGKGQEYVHLRGIDFSHPVFSVFAKPFSGDLTRPRFQGLFKLDVSECREAKVLARFDNGLPALAERRFGLGKCVVFASTASAEWTDFPKHMVYAPLVHQLIKHLSARKEADAPRTQVGRPAAVPRDLLARAAALIVRGPDGKERRVPVARQGRTFIPGVDRPGEYVVDALVGEQQRRKRIWRFAAALDTVESDLSPASRRRIEELSKRSASKAIAAEEATRIEASDADLPPGLWRALFLLALACMAIELLIGNRHV